MPSPSKAHRIPWLKTELLKRDIAAETLEVPFAYNIERPVWKKEVEGYEINRDTIIVGHSRGAGFWL